MTEQLFVELVHHSCHVFYKEITCTYYVCNRKVSFWRCHLW